jgi:4-hydroxy-tetrahydrodipicolinate synthase
MMAVGAQGVISVASNLLPREVSEMVAATHKGDFARAGRIHAKLYPVFKDLFIETNPIPIKAAMAMAGLIEEHYRLPLVPMSDANRKTLRETLRTIGVL